MVQIFDIKKAVQTTFEGESQAFKISKINQSKYTDNIEFFIQISKKEDYRMSIHPICANKNASLISYNIKLVEDSSQFTKNLVMADAFWTT